MVCFVTVEITLLLAFMFFQFYGCSSFLPKVFFFLCVVVASQPSTTSVVDCVIRGGNRELRNKVLDE
jgi:hypothetical protein